MVDFLKLVHILIFYKSNNSLKVKRCTVNTGPVGRLAHCLHPYYLFANCCSRLTFLIITTEDAKYYHGTVTSAGGVVVVGITRGALLCAPTLCPSSEGDMSPLKETTRE